MIINFGDQEFLLDSSGALFWPDQSLLIVSDLHLEKGSHFVKQGFFLPPYDSRETLERLHQRIKILLPRQILILGDCFHDPKGHARLQSKEYALFEEIKKYDPIWIRGNHDGDFVPDGFNDYVSYERNGIIFSHESSTHAPFEISGHFHPKAEILHKGALITRPCFIEDGNKMILPAFGSYTGGLNINHPSITKNFKNPTRVYIQGNKKIYYFE